MLELDLLEILKGIPSNERYSAQDRYHDFRRVLMGSPEGQRVLNELISWGRLFRPTVMSQPIDPYRMAVREGEQNYVRKLMAAVFQEPQEQPDRARRKHDQSTP